MPSMDITEINQQSALFRKRLDALKAQLAPQEFGWYPYGTLDN